MIAVARYMCNADGYGDIRDTAPEKVCHCLRIVSLLCDSCRYSFSSLRLVVVVGLVFAAVAIFPEIRASRD